MTQEQNPLLIFEGEREGHADALEPGVLLSYETP
jgi:hypothetical protein